MNASRSDLQRAEQQLRECQEKAGPLPLPDQELIDWVGGGSAESFDQIGLKNAVQLLAYAGLAPHHRVLEPGCGCGRNARWLAAYLDPDSGAYEGFDVHRGAIAWASSQITPRRPHVRFRHADVENGHYNPGGAIPSREFRFPYESEGFDVVFLPSVFTHMQREDFERYVSEIGRVLAPGGVLLAWHFLLDRQSRAEMKAERAEIQFKSWNAVSRVLSQRDPCMAVAFDVDYAMRTYQAAGLRVARILRGDWTHIATPDLKDFQDRILARLEP